MWLWLAAFRFCPYFDGQMFTSELPEGKKEMKISKRCYVHLLTAHFLGQNSVTQSKDSS